MSSRTLPTRARRLHPDMNFFDSADVVVVGLGAAGASAAIEAADHGAEVLVLEAASAGGGTTAMAGGLIYMGGGTPTQTACGISDSTATHSASAQNPHTRTRCCWRSMCTAALMRHRLPARAGGAPADAPACAAAG